MYILGINEGRVATAALLKDGEIIACVSEERFTRKKGQVGYPARSIAYCLEHAGISMDQVDRVVFGAKNPTVAIWLRFGGAARYRGITNVVEEFVALSARFMPYVLFVYQFAYRFFYQLYRLIKPFIRFFHHRELAKKLGIHPGKITFLDHHEAHAWTARGIFGLQNKHIIITNDGAGDDVCGRVFVAVKNHLTEIAHTPNRFSLAYLYYYVTKFLGFTPDEEEYKVMGLAGYANPERVNKLYPVFRRLFVLKNLSFQSFIDRISYFPYLKSHLSFARFDDIAGSIQRLIEDMTTHQVKRAMEKTHVHDVFLGGGLAMNVKANMHVGRLPEVKNLFVCPSPGDESAAIGACFWGYQRKTTSFQMYLGPSYSEEEILTVLANYNVRIKKISADRLADLLAGGEIVARFAGRAEFGARALGNRSILADPRDPKIIRILNEQIKNRDFWMPFAPTILESRAQEYLYNPKNLACPFMMLAFPTTRKAQQEIPATIHPHDYSCRPQILSRDDNPDYYDIIKAFEKKTGVGAVLNTSLNLHGEPIVLTPQDAVNTFLRSGLRYMLMENFLITK